MASEMHKTRAWNPCPRLPLQPLKNRNAYLKILESVCSVSQLTLETTDWPNDGKLGIPSGQGLYLIYLCTLRAKHEVWPEFCTLCVDKFESFG